MAEVALPPCENCGSEEFLASGPSDYACAVCGTLSQHVLSQTIQWEEVRLVWARAAQGRTLVLSSAIFMPRMSGPRSL